MLLSRGFAVELGKLFRLNNELPNQFVQQLLKSRIIILWTLQKDPDGFRLQPLNRLPWTQGLRLNCAKLLISNPLLLIMEIT